MKKILHHLDEIIISLTLALICAVLLLQVIFRRVLNNPLIWSEELARYLLVSMTMLAFGYNIRTNNNISMELLYSRFPKSLQKGLSLLADVLALGMFVYLLPSSFQYTMSQMGVRSATMRMPMVLLSGMVMLGIVLAIIQIVLDLVRIARGERRED